MKRPNSPEQVGRPCLVFLPHGPEQHTFTLPSSEKQGLLRPGVALQVGSLLLGKVEDSVDTPPPAGKERYEYS